MVLAASFTTPFRNHVNRDQVLWVYIFFFSKKSNLKTKKQCDTVPPKVKDETLLFDFVEAQAER